MTRTGEEREAVLGLLDRLVEAHPEQLRLLLTLRSDFEPQFDRSVLEARWKEARYVVPPMTQDEVRGVIEQPASQRVMYFKPSGLVDELINEIIQTPGGLPLLSFALSEMYGHYLGRRSDDRALETMDYEAVGGVVVWGWAVAAVVAVVTAVVARGEASSLSTPMPLPPPQATSPMPITNRLTNQSLRMRTSRACCGLPDGAGPKRALLAPPYSFNVSKS